MITKPNASVSDFIQNVQNFSLRSGLQIFPAKFATKLSWLLTAILFTGSMNMQAHSVTCLGKILAEVFSYFIHGSIPLLIAFWKASIIQYISILPYETLRCYLIIDDTDLMRSKVIKKIYGVSKGKHKPSGGFVNCQRIVVVAMVFLGVRIPLFFSFHRPDPKLSAWHRKNKKNKAAKSRGKKAPYQLPPQPARRKAYPTLIEIAIKLLSRCKSLIEKIEKITGKKIHIVSITFDAAFMSQKSYKQIKGLFPGVQIISQIKSTQLVSNSTGHYKSAENYFKQVEFQTKEVWIREQKKMVSIASARLQVKAIGAKLHIVAIRYEGQKEPRYVVASELTWRAIDIITAYSSRWIIEVLFEDLKQYCGLGRRACLQRRSGSCGTVILSMIADIYAHSTPEQLQRLRSGVPVLTTGSIARTLRTESVLEFMEEFVTSDDPKATLKQIGKALYGLRDARQSSASIMSESFFELGPDKSPQEFKKAANF